MFHAHASIPPMFIAAASVAVLPIAPALHRLTRWSPAAMRSLQLGIAIATILLIAVEILPECVGEIGPLALLAAAAGLSIPIAFERRAAVSTGNATSCLVAVGLSLHALTDGLAIAGGEHHHEHAMGLAVVLHRIPVALALWWTLRPRGRTAAIAALTLLGVCTIAGFGVGGALVSIVDTSMLWWFQAFAAGVLVHVMFHRGGVR